MTDQRAVRERLEREPIPGERDAEERAWEVVRAAYADRTPPPATARYGRFAAALAGTAALAALVLSPAGAEVRDWIGDAIDPGIRNAEPALTSLPTEGRVLVESAQGPWIVDEDGSKRLLGDYEQATWSPQGRFVAVTEGRELSAVVAEPAFAGQPAGTVRWSLSQPRSVRDPVWAPSAVRIAYRAGGDLWVVNGDGTGRRPVAESIGAAEPAWRPLGGRVEQTRTASGVVLGAANVLAYVDGSQRIHVLDVDSKRELVRPIELETPVRAIHWTANGRDLVVITSGALLRVALGEDDPSNPYRGLRPASLIAAEPSPQRASEVAALALRSGGSSERQSELLLLRDEATSSLSSGPGRFTDIAWSPDGRWLLLAWRDADQWLFLRPGADPGRSVIPVDNISSQFDPGGSGPAGFPRIAGWCCAR